MNLLIRSLQHAKQRGNRQQCNSWQAFVLISLLLFLPLGQADHLEQHNSLPSDIHCQLLHATSDIDDLKGSLNTVTTLDAIELLITSHYDQYQFNYSTTANIRAPPVQA